MNKKGDRDKVAVKGKIEKLFPDKVSILFDEKEYILPRKIFPKEIDEGENLILSISRESSYRMEKEKTAKELLNEILNDGGEKN